MDRQLLERLIGAGVLVIALVVVVPAILDGDPDKDSDSDADAKSAIPAEPAEPRRTHTIRLDRSTESPPVAREVTEPAVTLNAEPTREVARAVSPKPDASVTTERQPVKPAAPEPAKPAPPKPAAKVSTDPPPTRPPSKPKPVAAKPAPVPDSGWVVQLGSFSNKQNAQRLADEVSGRGFPAFLMALDRSGKKLYRVRVGPRETRAQATELAGRLAKVGYSGQVTRQQPDA